MSASGSFDLARTFMEENVHSPTDFAAMLSTMSIIFASWGTALSLQIVVAANDWSGWIGIIFVLVASFMAIATTIWVYHHSPSAQVTENALNMLAVTGVAWGFIDLIVSGLTLWKGDPKLLGLKLAAISLGGIAIGLGILALCG